MFRQLLAAGAAVIGLAAVPAGAAVVQVDPPVTGSFVATPPPSGTGTYGVELRQGDSGGRRTWEIGVGQQTSNTGTFNSANYNWGAADGSTLHDFTLVWSATGLSITVGGTTVTDAGIGKAAPLLPTSDTLHIFGKNLAGIYLAEIDGTVFNTQLKTLSDPSTSYYFWSPDNWGGNGFTASGKVQISTNLPGGSSSEVFFKLGDYTSAVPEPATWAMLILGFGAVGAVARRRRVASVSA
jgi:hypothetical protein